MIDQFIYGILGGMASGVTGKAVEKTSERTMRIIWVLAALLLGFWIFNRMK